MPPATHQYSVLPSVLPVPMANLHGKDTLPPFSTYSASLPGTPHNRNSSTACILRTRIPAWFFFFFFETHRDTYRLVTPARGNISIQLSFADSHTHSLTLQYLLRVTGTCHTQFTRYTAPLWVFTSLGQHRGSSRALRIYRTPKSNVGLVSQLYVTACILPAG